VTDPRWQRVKALFQAALERPETERAAFLEGVTGGDEDVRREVESLLASDAASRSVFERFPLADAVAKAQASNNISAPDETRAHAALSAGDRVGTYEVVEPIGAGAMGQVYRARDTRLNRDVALKVLPEVFALDVDRIARFQREAQMLAALNHPNIAAIYGVEESKGRQALVLELVEGPTIAEAIARGPIPLDETASLARQMADALGAAHDKGIIHRDLKPANVKITSAGAVKVLDFGLAKVWAGAAETASGTSPTVTATSLGERAILGTPAYMSPEQARGRPLDKRTDIWSFGCVLFEMLTGRSAFGGDTISDTIARVLERDVDWNALPRACPPRVRDVLRRCLQKDVNRRMRDIGDARLELEEATSATPEGHSAGAPALTSRTIARSWLFRSTAAAAVASIAIAGLTFVVGRPEPVSLPVFRQVTFRHGSLRGARLARDGQTVVYSAAWIGTPQDLYVVRPESVQSGAIGLQQAGIFSVSPKGDLAIALGCRLNWGECFGTLAQVPMTGGVPRELVKDVQGADWSPDGQQLAVVSFAGGKFRLEYPIGKVVYEPSGWMTYARVSPRGDRVAFLDHPQLGDMGGTVAFVDRDGKKTMLSTGWKSLQGLAWSKAGDEVWFTGSRSGKGGSSSLYAVTLAGQERAVFNSPGELKLHDISPDGTRVLLTRGTTRGGIVGLGPNGTKDRDLSWFDYSTVADLSSDGKTLLFYEWGEGVAAKRTVFVRGTDGGDALKLGEGRPLALSPDGLWALAVQDESSTRIVLLPTRTGDMKSLPPGPVAEYLDWATWSPDRRHIFFAGREASDVRRTYLQDLEGGEPKPVTQDGYVGMALSPDGRTLVTVDRYGEYYLCAVDGGVGVRVLPGYIDGDIPLQWSADGRFLFVRETGNLTLRIHRLNISTGTRELWKELVPPDRSVLMDIGSDPGQVRITPDGKSYAYTYWTFDGELYIAQGLK
jgi:serine/threonine protein kinase/Tol biopolymer transport system component